MGASTLKDSKCDLLISVPFTGLDNILDSFSGFLRTKKEFLHMLTLPYQHQTFHGKLKHPQHIFKTSESCLRTPVGEVSGDCRQCTAEKFNFTQTFTFPYKTGNLYYYKYS